jgi:hypothetical protein
VVAVAEKEFSFKGKGLTITCHEGTAGRGMGLLIFNLDSRWGWVVYVMSLPLYPWKRAQVPIVQEAGGAQELVYMGVEKRKSLALTMV